MLTRSPSTSRVSASVKPAETTITVLSTIDSFQDPTNSRLEPGDGRRVPVADVFSFVNGPTPPDNGCQRSARRAVGRGLRCSGVSHGLSGIRQRPAAPRLRALGGRHRSFWRSLRQNGVRQRAYAGSLRARTGRHPPSAGRHRASGGRQPAFAVSHRLRGVRLRRSAVRQRALAPRQRARQAQQRSYMYIATHSRTSPTFRQVGSVRSIHRGRAPATHRLTHSDSTRCVRNGQRMRISRR